MRGVKSPFILSLNCALGILGILQLTRRLPRRLCLKQAHLMQKQIRQRESLSSGVDLLRHGLWLRQWTENLKSTLANASETPRALSASRSDLEALNLFLKLSFTTALKHEMRW